MQGWSHRDAFNFFAARLFLVFFSRGFNPLLLEAAIDFSQKRNISPDIVLPRINHTSIHIDSHIKGNA